MYDYLKCKVILVGDSGVGKTSIISRLINKVEKYPKPTLSLQYVTKEEIIDNEKVIFEIWDTAGQEKYLSLNRIFYSDAKICIIVYDITNKKSYENAINIWFNEIKGNSNENIIIGLAGNKCDLFLNEEINETEVRNFCSLNNIQFNLTSTFLNIGIDSLFSDLWKKYYKISKDKSITRDSTIISLSTINFNKKNKTDLSHQTKCC